MASAPCGYRHSGAAALQVPEHILDQGILDEALSFSEPLNLIKAFEVPVFAPVFIETHDIDPVQMMTTEDGVKELTTKRAIRSTVRECDISHTISAAEQILKNLEGIEEEKQKEI
jgi:hypothetical protein